MYPHPSFASSQNNVTLTVDPQDATTLAFVPSQCKKRRIDGLSSWLEAWNVFLHSTISIYPSLAPDLLAYQVQICKFSRKFKASAWLMYYTAFRYMAALHVAMSWGKVYEQLYNDIVKEETLPYCVHCHTYGHRTLGCPTRSKSVQPFHPFSSSTTTPSPNTFGAASNNPLPSRNQHPLQAAICRDFNRWACRRPNCHFKHICNKPVVETTLALNAQKYPNCNSTHPILTPASTPVNVANLSTELKHHPNEQFVTSLLHNLQWGCHVGYTSPRFARIAPNLTSALVHPDAVSAALAKEVSNGHTAGPFQTPPIPNLQCSPLGVVLCLVPVRRLFRPSRSMHFGDVSKTNGQETPRQSRSAHAWAFLKSSHVQLK